MPLSAGEIDSRINIVTPENIAFHYWLAGPFRRFAAYGIDVVIRLLAMFGLGFAISMSGFVFGKIGFGVLFVAWFISSWFYGGLFETFWNGQTPGKRILGLRVLTRDGQPIDALQAVLRNILRTVDTMPAVPLPGLEHTFFPIPVYSLGLVTMAATDRYERWGDLVCGTMVVVEERRLLRGVIQVDDAAVRNLASQLPANYRPSQSLARAISAYVERRRFFGAGRRAEISRIVGEPLCQRFGLPPETSHDLLMCAVYYHTFVVERVEKPSAGPTQKLPPRAKPAATETPLTAEIWS